MAYTELQAIYSGHPVYARYPSYAPPVEPLGTRRLPPPMEGPISSSGGRMIQPKPPGGSITFSPNLEEPARKKRGRPTNAEMARKAEEAAARGEPYPPPKRPRAGRADQPSPRTSMTTDVSQATAGSPTNPALALSTEKTLSTPTAPAAPGSEQSAESPSSKQKQSVQQQEGTMGVVGSPTPAAEPRETPSRITITSLDSPAISKPSIPVEGPGMAPLPSGSSREETQPATKPITTGPTLPESRND
ncbi:MAG: hypothetical protein Q9157_006763 [Trypethelium eluteriae]